MPGQTRTTVISLATATKLTRHFGRCGRSACCGLRGTAARFPSPAQPSRRSPPPAFAFAERAVAALPVVTVGVTVMPAGTQRDPARPHPSQHSSHLCLSLLSYGRDPGLLSLATDMLGSTRRSGPVIYPQSAMSLRTSEAVRRENTAIFLSTERSESPNQV